MSASSLRRPLVGEFVGSMFLAMIVVGSGIAAQQLSPGNLGLELLENALATAAGLFVLIVLFAPVSGAHFNPIVTVVDAIIRREGWRRVLTYIPTQIAGCIGGAILANLMFSQSAVTWSTHHRATGAHLLSEIIATSGLLIVIFGLSRSEHSSHTPAAVGSYIGAAYFFTSSTSFANPAITVGRTFSNTFAGIAPSSILPFIGVQVVGGALALVLVLFLYPHHSTVTS